jgi:hypothetical protein
VTCFALGATVEEVDSVDHRRAEGGRHHLNHLFGN